MPLLATVDATVTDFDEVFDRFKSENEGIKKILLFLADKDPTTNESWCPDCVVSEPVIYKKLEDSSADVVLLRAFVGDRATWRTHTHPFRNDPDFKLTGVPTLIRWENDKIIARLEDYQACVEKKIDGLLATD
ncbi:Thioredoxin domain-containing protein [Zostera marina]|uniref:Thioredoxin-like protein Clot n=1 Tax=Zostera marina TaxID=29655 RepID=A0A0K9PJ26_ZOSMR|nr:Thioredoxin domain-containing protein [Zostera marina]